MFRKDIKIGEGDKYDLTKVSTQSVNQEEVAKKNAKLIEIFKKFDIITKDGKLDSSEMAMAMDYFNSLDESGNDKISKKEFKEAAEAFNKERQLTGKDKVEAKDLKTFIKNLFSATQNDPTAETQKVLQQYQKQQEQMHQEELQRMIDDAAKSYGWEWAFGNEREGAYYDKKTGKYYLPNKDGTAFIEVHWSDSEQRFKVMSEEELAQLNAALEAQRAEEEAAAEAEENKNKTYGYVVQPDESFTDVVTKSLKAQGIENPTEEQIAEAKEQFKKDNPNAIRTTSDGYEFLLVGEQVKLRGEVEYAQNSQEAIAQWAEDNPALVWKSKAQREEEARIKQQREESVQTTAESIAPDLTPKETIDEDLQQNAQTIQQNQTVAKDVKEEIEEILTKTNPPDWQLLGVMSEKDRFNKDTVAYIIDEQNLEKIEQTVINVDKNRIYGEILGLLKERAKELNIKLPDELTKLPDEMILNKKELINKLSADIRSAEQKTVENAKTDKESYETEQAMLAKINENKEFFEESNRSLAHVVDMAENEPDSVSFGTYDDGSEYCVLEDGTKVNIERDEEGNITSILIRNPGGPDTWYDIRYNASGFVHFDPEGKADESGRFKESIGNAPFDFEKIKALAERIWAAKPKAAEE